MSRSDIESLCAMARRQGSGILVYLRPWHGLRIRWTFYAAGGCCREINFDSDEIGWTVYP